MALPADIEQLKSEGNALFAQSSYLLASDKYTAAIEKFKDSPILYANRAACFIGLRRFVEAAGDAQRATELDKNYAKGWGRLGAAQEALGNNTAAHVAYAKALTCFPPIDTHMSDAERRLKQQYERAHYLLGIDKGRPVVMQRGGAWEKRLPWDLAKKLMPQPPSSSAHVILAARAEFEVAMKLINGQRVNGLVVSAMTGGLDHLTNAILQDERCFRIFDPEFQTKYNTYVMFEAAKRGAWVDAQHEPAELIRLAKDRLARSGWDSVRPALSITVRACIMRAFLIRGVAQKFSDALDLFERAIEILDLGRREWSDVATEQRGAIFEPTFVRGVRVMHINTYMAAGASSPGRTSPYPLSRLLELADEMLVECATNTRGPNEQLPPEFINAFEIFPVGTALSIKGFYHVQMAKLWAKTPEEVMAHTSDGAKFYLEAAEKFPEDDETHAWFLHLALDCLFQLGTKLKTTLPLMARIRAASPKMRKIWEHSAMAMTGRDAALDLDLQHEDELRKGLEEGKFTLEDQAVPEIK